MVSIESVCQFSYYSYYNQDKCPLKTSQYPMTTGQLHNYLVNTWKFLKPRILAAKIFVSTCCLSYEAYAIRTYSLLS
jgi:hypothetical protein